MECSQSIRNTLSNHVFWLVGVISAVCIVWLYVDMFGASLQIPASSDFYKFYYSGQRLNHGQSMYWQSPSRTPPQRLCPIESPQDNKAVIMSVMALSEEIRPPLDFPCLHPNLNPPFSALFFRPMAKLSYHHAFLVWQAASVFSAILVLGLIFRTQGGTPLKFVRNLMVFFSLFPTWVSFEFGQLTAFLLLFLTLGWIAMKKGSDDAAGVWIGIAASIKPFIALFLLSFVFCRAWRSVRAMVFTGGVALLLGGAVAGFPAYMDFAMITSNISWYSVGWNASFQGFFMRIFGGAENTPLVDQPMLAYILTIMCSVVVLSLLFILISKNEAANVMQKERRADLVFFLTIPAMLLLSPLGWIYYFPLLLISVHVYMNITVSVVRYRVDYFLLLACLLLSAIPRGMISASEVEGAYQILWDGSLYFYILLTFFLLCIRLVFLAQRRGCNSYTKA